MVKKTVKILKVDKNCQEIQNEKNAKKKDIKRLSNII